MIDHLSHSSIDLFLACPEAWRRKYIAQEPTGATPALVFGSAFHGALEAYLADPVVTGPIAHWSGAWEKALERDRVDWGEGTPEEHFNEGVRLLSNDTVHAAVRNLTVRCNENGPQIERKITLRVPGVPVPVIGYIDFIAADGVPCDLKTAARAWTADKAGSSLQGLYYLAALSQAGQHDHEWRFRHIVFVKTKTPQVQVLEHRHNPGAAFWVMRLVKAVWGCIEREAFYPNPTGWKCSPLYCDYWGNCRGRHS